jgi:hypothetical protein
VMTLGTVRELDLSMSYVLRIISLLTCRLPTPYREVEIGNEAQPVLNRLLLAYCIADLILEASAKAWDEDAFKKLSRKMKCRPEKY